MTPKSAASTAERSLDETAAVDMTVVLQAEANEIRQARERRKRLHDAPPVGLTFSGGGIRSATFNLGILQGLAELGLLPMFDYLSTVSGGGYIGTWLISWIHRTSLHEVTEGLRRDRNNVAQGQDVGQDQETPEIRRLREYSNYLTPKLGLTSGDTWAFIGGYVRNLLLTQLILVLVLIALMLLPWLGTMYFWSLASGRATDVWPTAGVVLLLVALTGTMVNLGSPRRVEQGRAKRFLASPGQVGLFVLWPMAIGVALLWGWWWKTTVPIDHLSTKSTALALGFWHLGLWVAAWVLGVIVRGLWPRNRRRQAGADRAAPSARQPPWTRILEVIGASRQEGVYIVAIVLSAWVSGAVGGVLLVRVTWWLRSLAIEPWQQALAGIPLATFITLAMQILHVGLVGRRFTEEAREWWGRMGGVLAFRTLALTVFCSVALFSTSAVESLCNSSLKHVTLATVWSLVTGAGVLVGRSSVGSGRAWRAIIVRGAPPIFIVGLAIGLAALTANLLDTFVNGTHAALKSTNFGTTTLMYINKHLGAWPDTTPPFGHGIDASLWIAVLALAASAFGLAYRTGINRCSMNSLYRNRLVRCYLGATKANRRVHPFTGMDPGDDNIAFSDLASWPRRPTSYQGPFPIYNTALNLVDTKDLAWQQRKAASYVLTPLYSGFNVVNPKREANESGARGRVGAFRPSAGIADLRLGIGMSISGAAASPNMGYQSTSALAFLLTVFNVRLGWWMGNPLKSAWNRLGPRLGLLHLFSELTGQTNHEKRYVYLSDGGHFENLGLYELVRRGCRFIVVCDAAEDHALLFGDLGNAIEKCRTDLCVDIDIDIEPLRRTAKVSRWHCAVGTIRYDHAKPGASAGTLVYLKATLTGNEPTDVQRYADQCPAFPHESTADQWFTESQFESYRALGHHIAHATFDPVGSRAELETMTAETPETLFVRLRQFWYPPSRFAPAFTKHTATYTALLDKMRSTRELAFLDPQVYPEWGSLMHGATPPPGRTTSATLSDVDWLPPSEDERRAGFYFCNEVIQLFEDAYVDLNLEEEFDHPDNRGWCNLFAHWAGSAMFRATWAISVGIYGARFQNFCEHRANLWPGRIGLGTAAAWPGAGQVTDQFWQQLRAPGMDLNSWELSLVEELLGTTPGIPAMQIIPIRMIVQHEPPHPKNQLEFTVGFVVGVSGKNNQLTLSYIRIQDHLRKMGLAQEALRVLTEQRHVEWGSLPAGATAVHQRQWGEPSKADAHPSEGAARSIDIMLRSLNSRRRDD